MLNHNILQDPLLPWSVGCQMVALNFQEVSISGLSFRYTLQNAFFMLG